jgi:4-hydroxy-tetrahydrodipicolinate synthase
VENADKTEIWPVMLTPFTDSGAVDYRGLAALIEWYEAAGVYGLFAVCQSSEMFFLSLRERVELARFIKKRAKIPVIASGHVSVALEDQLDELERIAGTGVDAVIMLTNRFAQEGDSRADWLETLKKTLDGLDRLGVGTQLGLYECPYPYKHLLSDEELVFCRDTGKFRFIKDTCCNIDILRRRVNTLRGSPLKLYNANSATLLESLKAGAAGFSGVMANFYPEMYVHLANIWRGEGETAKLIQDLICTSALIERQWYPVNAKYHLMKIGLPMGIYTRSKTHKNLSPLFMDEVDQMDEFVGWAKKGLGIPAQ